jgi:hypothetical protein
MPSEKVERVTRKQPRGVREIHLKMIERSSGVKPEKSLEELAKEQGVKPFDATQDGKNWPKGADYDELMKAIKSGRNNGH